MCEGGLYTNFSCISIGVKLLSLQNIHINSQSRIHHQKYLSNRIEFYFVHSPPSCLSFDWRWSWLVWSNSCGVLSRDTGVSLWLNRCTIWCCFPGSFFKNNKIRKENNHDFNLVSCKTLLADSWRSEVSPIFMLLVVVKNWDFFWHQVT